MQKHARRLTGLVVVVLGLTGALVAQWPSGPGGLPGQTAWAADRSAGRRLLVALSSDSDNVFELWERRFPVAWFERLHGAEHTDLGPEGKGPPERAFYLLRRSADGSRRYLLGSAYTRNWMSRLMPPAAGSTYSAAFAIDPGADTLSVVVLRSQVGYCEAAHFTVSAVPAGEALQGGDPFPAEDPAGTWPPGPLLHESGAPGTRGVRLVELEARPVVARALVSAEEGLLVYARPEGPAKVPIYLRWSLGGEKWTLAKLTER
jgi:hypothetical protein